MGGLMAHSGEDVSLIARGANLEALRADGLTVKSLTVGERDTDLSDLVFQGTSYFAR